MAYIGKSPTVGNFIKLDDISTSSTNTYNLLHGGVAFSPETANHMLVSLNGVIQAPNTAFSVSGSQITFLPSSGTLSSSDSIDFIMVYGNVLDVGVASSVADSAITKGKLNLISDSSSAGLTVKGDGSSENGTIQLNCSQNSHGVKISSPAHSSGQSYEMVLPTTNITAGKFLKVDSVSGSGATGIGQLSFADAGGNAPAFEAKRSQAAQSISNETNTKIEFNTEIFDSASAYDHSTNYRFTPQTAGKYFVYARVMCRAETNGNLEVADISLRKNGSVIGNSRFDYQNSRGNNGTPVINQIVDMNGSSDYVEAWGQVKVNSGNAQFYNDGQERTIFGAFKLGGL